MSKFFTKLLLFLAIFYLSPDISLSNEKILSEIIHKAQQNNRKIFESIDNLKYKVHSRTYIYFGFTPFDVNLVPYFEEYYADGYWEKPDSTALKIYALKVISAGKDSSKSYSVATKELSLPNPFLFDYNILSKNKGSVHKRPYYPFSEGAEKYYNYEYEGFVKSGMMDVISIAVTPKFLDVPSVEGSFLLDRNDSWIVASDFKYNDAAKFTSQISKKKRSISISIKITSAEERTVRTKKSLYYSPFWLPELMEEDFFLYIWGMKVKVHRIIEFDSYVINTPNFKTVKPAKRIEYSIDSQLQDSILTQPEYPDRLSKEEEEEILAKIEDKIRSEELFSDLKDLAKVAEKSAMKRLKEKGGKLFSYGERTFNFFQYNRVEGLYFGNNYKFANPYIKNFALSVAGGYGFEDKKFKGELVLLKLFGKKRNFFVDLKIFSKLGFEEEENLISTGKNTFTALFSKEDYRDYYAKKGFAFDIRYKLPESNIGIGLSFVSQIESSVGKNTDFSIFRRNHPFRLNPEAVEGRYNGLEFLLKYNTYRINAETYFKYTNRDMLKSDFSYSIFGFKLGLKHRLTYFSRLFFNLNSGFSSGSVAPQKWFDFGGKVFANYRGKLRGVDYKYFTGDRMVSSVIEYHLNGRALKKIGLNNKLFSAVKFILYNGVGWSELSDRSRKLLIRPPRLTPDGVIIMDVKGRGNLNVPSLTTDGVYYEFGLGISDILNIFRFDFIHNNIDNKIIFEFNFLR